MDRKFTALSSARGEIAMNLPDHEYKNIMQNLLKEHVDLSLHEYGHWWPNGIASSTYAEVEIIRKRQQTPRYELLSDKYINSFECAVGGLNFLLPLFCKPEETNSIKHYLKRRHPKVKFFNGIIAAAALYLGYRVLPCINTNFDQPMPQQCYCSVIVPKKSECNAV